MLLPASLDKALRLLVHLRGSVKCAGRRGSLQVEQHRLLIGPPWQVVLLALLYKATCPVPYAAARGEERNPGIELFLLLESLPVLSKSDPILGILGETKPTTKRCSPFF